MSSRHFFTSVVRGIYRIDTFFPEVSSVVGRRESGRELCLLSCISVTKIAFKPPLIYALVKNV